MLRSMLSRLAFGAFPAALCAGLAVADPAAGQAPAPPIPVIDVHMHTPLQSGVAAWRAAMTELNVRAAVLIGTPRQWRGMTGLDDPRFLPSLTFPCEDGRVPNVGWQCFDDGAAFPDLAALRRWAQEGRIRALGEVNAQYMGIAPGDPRLEPYYALAEELDLPLGIHLGIGPPGLAYQRPGFPPRRSPHYRAAAGDVLALEDVLIRHPRLRLYVMHAAWPMTEDMLYMLYMHPQLHVDVSVLQWAIPRAAYYAHLRRLVEGGFADRIMFGSDGGVQHLRAGIEAILNADFLTPEQKRAILHDNAARFFRLGAEAGPSP